MVYSAALKVNSEVLNDSTYWYCLITSSPYENVYKKDNMGIYTVSASLTKEYPQIKGLLESAHEFFSVLNDLYEIGEDIGTLRQYRNCLNNIGRSYMQLIDRYEVFEQSRIKNL